MALKKKNVNAIYEALSQRDVQMRLTNSSLCMKRLKAKMDMSAWKSTLIWRMTPKDD